MESGRVAFFTQRMNELTIGFPICRIQSVESEPLTGGGEGFLNEVGRSSEWIKVLQW
jgi:hypothetical protein